LIKPSQTWISCSNGAYLEGGLHPTAAARPLLLHGPAAYGGWKKYLLASVQAV
jgi:hypothetical protein